MTIVLVLVLWCAINLAVAAMLLRNSLVRDPRTTLGRRSRWRG